MTRHLLRPQGARGLTAGVTDHVPSHEVVEGTHHYPLTGRPSGHGPINKVMGTYTSIPTLRRRLGFTVPFVA